MALQPAVIPPPPPPMGAAPGGKLPPPPMPMPKGAMPRQALPAGAAGASGEPPLEIGPHLTFWQQPWVQTILPFLTSLTLHVGLIVLALALWWTYKAFVAPTKEQEQTTVAESAMAENEPPGGVPNVGTNNDPFKEMMQDKTTENTKPDGVSSKDSLKVELDPGGGSGENEASALIGGSNSGIGTSIGGGKGDSFGNGSGEGGPLAKFGAPGGGAIGPHGLVFGNGGNARHIVFVCDASGSMLPKMPSLKNELQKAVDGLKFIQTFDIIFFHDQTCISLDKNQLIAADSTAKRNASKFLDDVTAAGTTDPIPGLTLAFSLHPQLIYVLTDGDFPDNKAVKAKINELNHDHKVKINTIAFTNASDTDTDFLTLLKEIADENGGKFRPVKENELNQ